MGVHKRVQHIRKDNLVTGSAGLKIKRPGWSFQYCERPHGGCWAITSILTFCLPAAKWWQSRPRNVLLRSENFNIAIHLFACGCLSPDKASRECEHSRIRWNVLLQKFLSGNAGYELSHAYRKLSGPYTKMLIIVSLQLKRFSCLLMYNEKNTISQTYIQEAA